MVYKFTARSTTPTEQRLTDAAIANLLVEQLATDQAEVNSHVSWIVDGQVVLTGANAGTHVDIGPVRILGIKASA